MSLTWDTSLENGLLFGYSIKNIKTNSWKQGSNFATLSDCFFCFFFPPHLPISLSNFFCLLVFQMSKCKIHTILRQPFKTTTTFYSGQSQHNVYRSSSHIFSRCGRNVSAGLDSSACSAYIPSVTRCHHGTTVHIFMLTSSKELLFSPIVLFMWTKQRVYILRRRQAPNSVNRKQIGKVKL